jgi:uncharacterized protein
MRSRGSAGSADRIDVCSVPGTYGPDGKTKKPRAHACPGTTNSRVTDAISRRGAAMTSFLDPLLRGETLPRALVNHRHGGVVAQTILPAFDSSSRRRGLLGRDAMPADCALIIAPSNAIHTFFMRFAIDVAFVARDGRVLSVRRGLPPRRIAAAWRGFAVVELASGALDRADVRPGDTLRGVTR